MENIGIYIHIPFCVRKCAYCDFLSGPADEVVQRKYVDALISEIRYYASLYGDRYRADTVFLGGGTPSILKGEMIKVIMSALRNNFCIDKEAEISVEVNPGTITESKLETYSAEGINRISIGLQSSVESELDMLGRIHTYDDFLLSYKLCRDEGFRNINVDIMSGLPGQSLESFSRTLSETVGLFPEHISVYSLILEEKTPLKEKVERGFFTISDEETEREMYYRSKAMLESAGYHRYEISNYARDGFECVHNMKYWRRKPYIGFGVGAASFVDNIRYKNITSVDKYIRLLDDDSPVAFDSLIIEREFLTLKDSMEEFMFLGLRMAEGVSREDFLCEFGKNIEDVYGDVLTKYIDLGMIEKEKKFYRLTDKGIDVSNKIFVDFLLDDN